MEQRSGSRHPFRAVFFDGGASLRWIWQLVLGLPILGLCVVLIAGSSAWLAGRLGWMPSMGESPAVADWPYVLSLSIFRYAIPISTLLLGFHLAQRWLRGESLGDLGLRVRAGWWRELLLGFGLAAVAMGVSICLSWLLGWYRPLGFVWMFQPATVFLPALIRNMLIQVQAGLVEEVGFRGYLMRVLEKRWGMVIAIAASSILFGLAHLTSPGTLDYPLWMVFLSTALGGVVYALAYLTYRNLWIPIGLHFMHDWLIHLLGEVGRAPKDAVFVATQVSGPPVLQGPQSAGLGLFDLLGLAVVALILFLLHKQSQNEGAVYFSFR